MNYLSSSRIFQDEDKQNKLYDVTKILYKSISDSFYLNIQNEILAKALVIMLYESNTKQHRKNDNKMIASVLYNLRQKQKKIELKEQDTNI